MQKLLSMIPTAKKYNKASATVIAGALVQIIAEIIPIEAATMGVLTTILTMAAVAFVPNIVPAPVIPAVGIMKKILGR